MPVDAQAAWAAPASALARRLRPEATHAGAPLPLSRLDAVVIGAGAAGLAAARELAASGAELRLADAGDRAGGVMRSERLDGHLVERGPHTVLVRAPALAFLRRHGLESQLVAAAPASRRRLLWHDGHLEPVPTSLGGFVRTPLLSLRGKLRLLAEPFVRRGDPTHESVATFCARRFGPEVVTRLVAPALTGIYAGDERTLGAVAVLGAVAEAERSHGSVARGLLARAFASGPAGLRGSHGGRDGLGGLAAAIAAPLADRLVLGARARTIARADAGLRVELEQGGREETWLARHVVLAIPSRAAAELLAPLDAEAAALARAVVWAPVVSVALSIDPTACRVRPEGFGFLVPRDAGLRTLGCLFSSALFPGRAPPGRALLTCMLGGARWPAAIDESDASLATLVANELERTLGLRATPRVLAISRWPEAVAQPAPGHRARITALRARIAAVAPGLLLAGSWLDGVSIADTLASGAAAAARVLEATRGG